MTGVVASACLPSQRPLASRNPWLGDELVGSPSCHRACSGAIDSRLGDPYPCDRLMRSDHVATSLPGRARLRLGCDRASRVAPLTSFSWHLVATKKTCLPVCGSINLGPEPCQQPAEFAMTPPGVQRRVPDHARCTRAQKSGERTHHFALQGTRSPDPVPRPRLGRSVARPACQASAERAESHCRGFPFDAWLVRRSTGVFTARHAPAAASRSPLGTPGVPGRQGLVISGRRRATRPPAAPTRPPASPTRPPRTRPRRPQPAGTASGSVTDVGRPSRRGSVQDQAAP